MYKHQEYMVISPSSSINDLYNDNTGYYDTNQAKVSLGQVYNNDALTTNNNSQWLDEVIDLQELLEDIPAVNDDLCPISLPHDLSPQLSPISVQDVDDCFLSTTSDNQWSGVTTTSAYSSSETTSPALSPYMSPLTASVYNNGNDCFPFALPESPSQEPSDTHNYMENGSLSPAFSPIPVPCEYTSPDQVLSDITATDASVDFDFDIDFNTLPPTNEYATVCQSDKQSESACGPIRNKKSKLSKLYADSSKQISNEVKAEEKRIRKKQQNKDAAIRYRLLARFI